MFLFFKLVANLNSNVLLFRHFFAHNSHRVPPSSEIHMAPGTLRFPCDWTLHCAPKQQQWDLSAAKVVDVLKEKKKFLFF